MGEKKMTTLKERFERFMLAEQGVESVDRLMKDCMLPGRLRADYLAFERRAIIEQKSFDVDPRSQIQKFIDELAGNRAIDDYTQTSLDGFISQFPDNETLSRKLFERLTKGLDDNLSRADKQIRDTKKTFINGYAVGIVVILNDFAQVLRPDYVVHKAFHVLRKKVNREIRYQNIHAVILISEAHRIISDLDHELIPMETIYSDAGNKLQIATLFADYLKMRWANFNGAGYLGSPAHWRDVRTHNPMKAFEISRDRTA
jgi:hypothetical protein